MIRAQELNSSPSGSSKSLRLAQSAALRFTDPTQRAPRPQRTAAPCASPASKPRTSLSGMTVLQRRPALAVAIWANGIRLRAHGRAPLHTGRPTWSLCAVLCSLHLAATHRSARRRLPLPPRQRRVPNRGIGNLRAYAVAALYERRRNGGPRPPLQCRWSPPQFAIATQAHERNSRVGRSPCLCERGRWSNSFRGFSLRVRSGGRRHARSGRHGTLIRRSHGLQEPGSQTSRKVSGKRRGHRPSGHCVACRQPGAFRSRPARSLLPLPRLRQPSFREK